MARKFLTAIDLAQSEIQNARVQNLGGAPANPVAGQLYFNTANTTLWWCEIGGGSPTWISARGGGTGFPGFGSSTAETTFGTSKGDGVAGTTARADHTHGNPVHDSAAHSTIPISALAAATANVNMNNFAITNLGPPSSANDATNKAYVDNAIAGLAWKDPARLASTANVALTGLTAMDGVTPLGGDGSYSRTRRTRSRTASGSPPPVPGPEPLTLMPDQRSKAWRRS